MRTAWEEAAMGWQPTRRRLVANEFLVGDPVRAVGLGPELLVAEALVGLEVALEPAHLRVALEGEHVRGDAVEEPAIVGDDHRAPGEAEQRLFQRTQRV